jgi:hypothetical protein
LQHPLASKERLLQMRTVMSSSAAPDWRSRRCRRLHLSARLQLLLLSAGLLLLLLAHCSTMPHADAQPLSWMSLSAHLPALLRSRGLSAAAVSSHLAVQPPARSDFGVGYDARRARIVLFGGKSLLTGGEMDDTSDRTHSKH